MTTPILGVTSYQMLGLDYPSPTSGRSQDTLPRPTQRPWLWARLSRARRIVRRRPCADSLTVATPAWPSGLTHLDADTPAVSGQMVGWLGDPLTGPVGAQMRARFRFVQSVTGGPETSSDLVLRAILYLANRRSGDLKSGRATVRPRPWPLLIRCPLPRSADSLLGQRRDRGLDPGHRFRRVLRPDTRKEP